MFQLSLRHTKANGVKTNDPIGRAKHIGGELVNPPKGLKLAKGRFGKKIMDGELAFQLIKA